MTQEQKNLLMRDLCARLPYGVKIAMPGLWDNEITIEPLNEIFKGDYDLFRVNGNGHCIEYIKPYLIPISSMTEEQRKEYDSIIYYNVELHADRYYEVIDVDSFELLHDFYHKNHLDYRGLISMGLAIDATGLNIY